MAEKTDKEFSTITAEFKYRNDGVYIEYNGIMYKRMPQHMQKQDGLEAYVLELFNATFNIYKRKDAKAQAYKTWVKKFNGVKTAEDARELATHLYKVIMLRQKQFEQENRELRYYPMFSTLLNREVL